MNAKTNLKNSQKGLYKNILPPPRFWRALEEEFVEETVFESREELEEELLKYIVYYNEYRPHQGIDGKKPAELCKEKLAKNE